MEIGEALRIGYKTALTPVVGVPVFGAGSIPENQDPPYIIISTFTADQRMVDRCKVWECTQLLDIVTSSQHPTGFGQAYAIADLVEQTINPDSFIDIDITANGYRIGNTLTLSTQPDQQKNKTEYVYRILKRFRHLISKL